MTDKNKNNVAQKESIKSLQVKDKQERPATQPTNKFKPTEKMQEYLRTSVELLTDSPTKVTNNCSVHRRTWYNWVEITGFEDWYYNEYKRLRQRIIPKLDEIGMQQALEGKYDFWADMNKKVGDSGEDNNNVNVQVNNIIQKQRESYDV